MSDCNHTIIIPSNQCIGDSLKTINSNFSNLDEAICSIPTLNETVLDLNLETEQDLLGYPTTKITQAPNPILYSTFDTTNDIVISKKDSLTNKHVYEFPYNDSAFSPKQPVGTFDCISNSKGTPQITLLWSCSSSTVNENIETVNPLNSSVSFFNVGEISPNDYVSTFYQESKHKLYIGGSFTKIGNKTCNKMAVINLSGGRDSLTGNLGQHIVDSYALSSIDLGTEGDVTFIERVKIPLETRTADLMVVAGSFKSVNYGRSLTIWDDSIPYLRFPFYVNGTIHNCYIDSDYNLYVVGYFDFLNYGAGPQPSKSGQRIYTNSFAKINLKSLALIQNEKAIDLNFSKSILQTFSSNSEFFTLAKHENLFYIGGNFEIKSEGIILHKNLLSISSDGTINSKWRMIVNKSVRTILIDNPLSFMYIGGDFTKIVPQRDVYNDIGKPLSETTIFSRAAAFDISVEATPVITEWKPSFNGTVKKLIRHDSFAQSCVYAMGDFTQVNDTSVGHLACISKASDIIGDNKFGTVLKWSVYLPTATPQQSPVTNALLRNRFDETDAKSLFIGGTFARINNQQRFYFAQVTGIKGSLLRAVPQEIAWDVGIKILCGNESIDFNLSDMFVFRKKSYCINNHSIQKTVIKLDSPFFKNIFPGQYCRFFVKRPGLQMDNGTNDLFSTDDTFQDSVNLYGWYVQFV